MIAPATVTVTLEADGKIGLKAGGPGANKVTLLGLLEIGKQLLAQQDAAGPAPAAGPSLLLARGALPNGK